MDYLDGAGRWGTFCTCLLYTSCNHSARFQSVIGTGRVSFVDAAEERKAALQSIMRHNTGRDDWEFSDAMAEAVRILRLDVTELSCKEHP